MFNNEGLRTEPDPFVEKVDLSKKTKKQLEEYGRSLGIIFLLFFNDSTTFAVNK